MIVNAKMSIASIAWNHTGIKIIAAVGEIAIIKKGGLRMCFKTIVVAGQLKFLLAESKLLNKIQAIQKNKL